MGAEFTGATLAGAIFANTALSKANFSEVELRAILDTTANVSAITCEEVLRHPNAAAATQTKLAKVAPAAFLAGFVALAEVQGTEAHEIAASRLVELAGGYIDPEGDSHDSDFVDDGGTCDCRYR